MCNEFNSEIHHNPPKAQHGMGKAAKSSPNWYPGLVGHVNNAKDGGGLSLT